MRMSKIWLFFLLMVIPLVNYAQPPCGPPCDPGAPVPIPGILLIFLAGLTLGIYNKFAKKKPQ